MQTCHIRVLCAGCLPTLATIPVFWGLFRTFTNAAASGSFADGFYFIPSLAGPTLRGAPELQSPTACVRSSGSCSSEFPSHALFFRVH